LKLKDSFCCAEHRPSSSKLKESQKQDFGTERIVSAPTCFRSSSSMSVVSSSSLASDRNPESSYRDSSTSDHDQLTPSPPVYQDSHNEFTPTRKSTHSTSWTTLSQCSHTASISSSACEALNRLYKLIYGEDSLRCLVTQSNESLNVPHVVWRASTSDEVSHAMAFPAK